MNMKRTVLLGIMLFLFSVVLYFLNFLLYGDAHHLMEAFTEELAFMPVYVFITAVFAERMLSRSEKAEMSRRTNALVGTFYNEIGYDIVKKLIKFDSNSDTLKAKISIDSGLDPQKAKVYSQVSRDSHLRCAKRQGGYTGNWRTPFGKKGLYAYHDV